MTILELKEQPTYIIGDIHGEVGFFKTRIQNDEKIHDCNLIICGDIGLGFYAESKHRGDYNVLSKFLFERNVMLYLLRGNHDDPSYFTKHIIDKENIITLEDYTILKIGKTHILCIGGGISIDRTQRIKRYEKNLYWAKEFNPNLTEEELNKKVIKGYWKDEAPYYNEEVMNEICENQFPIHYVISHTSPSFCFKSDLKGIEHWLTFDEKLEEDLKQERAVLSQVYLTLRDNDQPLKEWVYGHFHAHHEEEFEGVKFTTLMNADFEWDVKELTLIND